MILASVPFVEGSTAGTPIAVRVIGVLDRALVETFTDSCPGLLASGRRTLILFLNDVVAMRDESLRRFVATLEAYRTAGHTVLVAHNPSWSRLFRHCGTQFRPPAAGDAAGTRRQLIIAQSSERRTGAA
ncbi:MAG: hypothetical protein ABR591_14960 [Candidatus Velthaea sp.]